ncbi:MAG: hypothetical protein HOQ03_03235 [Thermoleophilia bacterium]|nr:hypothetical protein [Thermoleophilia bacterium]
MLAHELWFVDRVPPKDWSFLWEGRTLALLGAALALTLLVRLAARAWPGVDVPLLARLVPWLPFAVRMHLGVALAGLLSGGFYLAPSMALEQSVTGWLLGLVEGIVAVLLIVGWNVRIASALLVVAGPLGMLEFGFEPVLHRVDLVGLAAFLLLAGPGRWSADHELGRVREPTALQLGQAVWALKVAVGVALIAVAVSEKLANPELARAFTGGGVTDLNVADALGLPVGDTEFIRVAGAIEVLFGLLVISGALPQLIVLAAGVPFNLTLYFFGTTELLGHLPVYAAMLVLLVLGSDPVLRGACTRLLPPAESPDRGRTPAQSTAILRARLRRRGKGRIG